MALFRCSACVARDETVRILREELIALRLQLSDERASHGQTRKDLTHVVDIRAGAISHRPPREPKKDEGPEPLTVYDAMSEIPGRDPRSPFKPGMTQHQVEEILERSRGGAPTVSDSETNKPS